MKLFNKIQNNFLSVRRIIASFALMAFMLSSCSTENEYDIFSDIEGIVTDYATGNPIADATVTLSPGNTSCITDENGKFAFIDIEAQNYSITVQKNEYQPNRRNIVTISGECVTVNIPLTKINK